MIHIDVGTDTERWLRHNAQVLGQPLESYLRRILETGASSLPASDTSPMSLEQALDALASEMPTHTPLPADFSRADIYDDHN